MQFSPSISVFLEVEVQREDAPIERAFEAVSLAHFPLAIHNSKYEILVGCARLESDQQHVVSIWRRLEVELRRFCLVKEIRVKYVEFVTLDDLGRWVFAVVVHLVVLVPFVALFYRVEVPWFPHHISYRVGAFQSI